jgi:hypothetical protein
MATFGYDILKKDSAGAPIWLEAVRDFDTAKKRVAELAENSPGEYVVFCEQNSQIVDTFVYSRVMVAASCLESWSFRIAV